MKKIIYTLFGAAFLFAACTQTEEPFTKDNTEAGGFSLTAGIGTKTVYTPPFGVEWEATDQLTVLVDGRNVKFTKAAGEGDVFTTSDFTPQESIEYDYNVFYPYYEGFTSLDENGVTLESVSLPYGDCGVQKRVSDASHVKGFLAGKTTAEGMESPNVTLSHLTSVITVNVTNTSGRTIDISGIEISTDVEGTVLGGNFKVDFAQGRLVADGTENSGTAVLNVENGTIDAGRNGVFYVIVPEFKVPAGNNIIVTVKTRANSVLSFNKTANEELDFRQGGVYNTSVDVDERPMMNGVELKDIKDNIMASCWDNSGTNHGVWFDDLVHGQEIQFSGIYDIEDIYNRDFLEYDNESGIVTYIGETQSLDVFYSSTMGYIWMANDGYDKSKVLYMNGYGLTQAPKWTTALDGIGWQMDRGNKYVVSTPWIFKNIDGQYSSAIYFSDTNAWKNDEYISQFQLIGFDDSADWIYYTITAGEGSEEYISTAMDNNVPTVNWNAAYPGYYRLTFTVDHDAKTAVMSAEKID